MASQWVLGATCVCFFSLALSLEKCATCHTLLLCVYWSELWSSSLCSKYFPPSNHLTCPRRVLLILTWILVYAFMPQCIFIAWTEKCFKLLFTSVIRVAYSHWIAFKVSQSRTWQFLLLVKIWMRHGVSLLLAAAKAPGCSLLSFRLCVALSSCVARLGIEALWNWIGSPSSLLSLLQKWVCLDLLWEIEREACHVDIAISVSHLLSILAFLWTLCSESRKLPYTGHTLVLGLSRSRCFLCK